MADEFEKTLKEIEGIKTAADIDRFPEFAEVAPVLLEDSSKRLEQFRINFAKKCHDLKKLQCHHYGSRGAHNQNY